MVLSMDFYMGKVIIQLALAICKSMVVSSINLNFYGYLQFVFMGSNSSMAISRLLEYFQEELKVVWFLLTTFELIWDCEFSFVFNYVLFYNII